MRVYLASRFSRASQLAGYAHELRAVGIDVTSRWHDGSHTQEADYTTNAGRSVARRHAHEDLADINRADLLILFGETPDAGYMSAGRMVEFGYAHRAGKKLAVVGPLENIFECLLGILRFPDWPTCRATLTGAHRLDDDNGALAHTTEDVPL